MKSKAIACIGALGFASLAWSAPQCGLYKADNGSVTVIQAGSVFSQKDILAKGGFGANGPNGLFGCWVSIGQDNALRAAKSYAYRMTGPSGPSHDRGPYGIQPGGFGSDPIPAYTETSVGRWIVEFFVVDRANGARQSLGSASFDMQNTAAGGTQPPGTVVQPPGPVKPGTTANPPPDANAGIPGRVWRVTEGDPSWKGVWTRRGNSNTFDVVNTRTYGNEVQNFTVTMSLNGNQIAINRGGQYYNGTLSSDRKRADGTATWYHPGTSWHATID